MTHALNPEQFEVLLRQLGPDRDLAGARYEQLRRRLVTILTYRGCTHPEEVADETMDRVARRLSEVRPGTEIGDPTRFVFGVAWNVAREWIRRQRTVPLPDGWDPADPGQAEVLAPTSDLGHGCLDRCLRCLPRQDKEVVLTYYQEEGLAKIRHRAMVARQLKVSQNALRLRIHRITLRLRECVFHCVDTARPGDIGLH
jgi:DNA-directed RNA polymerase specialized sigma24 family protein